MAKTKSKLFEDGEVKREGDNVIVRLGGNHEHLLSIAGVTCENPGRSVDERIYRRVLCDPMRKIYLPHELDRARREVLGGDDVVIVGMTGYSSIGEANCRAWGVTMERYEAACASILGHAVRALLKSYPGIRVKIVDGASNMGVDKAQISVAKHFNLDRLGHSCPKFLFYVREEDCPVYVAKSQSEYADAFVQSVHILYSVGGRIQALEHDMLAAIRYDKLLVPLNILAAISDHGGPPARDGDGNIQDATAAFLQALSLNVVAGLYSADPFKNICLHASEESVRRARRILHSDRAYGDWQAEQ